MKNSYFKSMNNDEIYLALKEDIINLRLAPGQLISENEISKKYNVSRTPVKTAFLKLSSERFIEIVPQKGTYVTLLDMELIKEIIYMRTVLESTVLKEIIGDIPEEIILKLAENLKEQEWIVGKDQINPINFYKKDSQFHALLFDFAGKIRLWEIIQEFQVYYTRFRMLDIVALNCFDVLYKEHCELFEIIKDGKKGKVDEMVNRHLHGNINRLGERIYKDLKDYFI